MTLLEALALGILQGVTEFLPISSSGHLALAQILLGRAPTSTLIFNVVVHLGTMLAIAWVLRERIIRLFHGLLSFAARAPRDPSLAVERSWILLILLANVPTGIVGLLMRDFVEQMSTEARLIGAAYLVTALLLVLAQRAGTRNRGPELLGATDALWIGCAQSLGILPGISRSGATVTVALWRGTRPEVAVEFGILISIPAIVAANVLELSGGGVSGAPLDVVPLAAGFGMALVTGIASLRILQWVVGNRHLLPFAAYCALLGAGAIFLG